MKKLIILSLVFGLQALAQESCKDIKQDVNTPVPTELKDKEVCIRDPKTKVLDCSKSMNDYKIVPRKQQFKVKEKVVVIESKVKDGNKNLIMLGARKDHHSYESETNGNSVTVYSKKALIFDLSYYRRQLFDSNIGLGIGIDTNTTLKALIGLEF